MSKRARWLGPSPTRRDGPEYRRFVRGRWEEITKAEAAYFERFPNTWEVGEGPLVKVDRKVVPAEPPMAEVEAPEEELVAEAATLAEAPLVEAEVSDGEPAVETAQAEALPEESDQAEEPALFAGSAIEEELEEGFVEVTEPEIDRDAGFV